MVNETKPVISATATAPGGPLHGIPGSSRSRRTVITEEDATKLQFGDFADGETLTPSDVQQLLLIRNQPGAPPAPDNKVYKTTAEYVNNFANASYAVVASMRESLQAQGSFLNKFEIAQIMYLRPERVEVAVALIPSLERYAHGDEDEGRLQQILDDVRTQARYAAQG
ncbi:HRDC-like protein [Naematelia encephala]|uniref:HRDC-like protein n=1 Tax=Naematelia encephala TaxID=71784 RepID=A0A1Y2AX58_9TREE|nr:HRDC-like protein [Naematelia encephala]